MKTKWIKFTERECDLFTAYNIMIGYLKNYRKNIGRNFRNFLMINKNGIIHSWRQEKEYGNFLKILKTKNQKCLENILDKLELKNKKLLEFLKYKRLDEFSDKSLTSIFKKFIKIYQNYFALFTLPKYFGMMTDEKNLSVKLKNKLKKNRGKADYEIIQKKFLPVILKEIGKRRNVNASLLFYSLPEEIIDGLRNIKSINNNKLLERKKFALFLTKNSKIKLYTGLTAKNIFYANVKTGYKIKDVDTIKGQVANKGLVRGRVKIVLRENNLNNLDGKIIVAPMTSIKFVPYLKNVKAIITNEGGIACHAAIISRELGKPCIIGTKIATKVLRNGDLVEVDAERGVIKIIKKA